MRAQRFLLLTILFILISLPYLYAAYAAGPGHVFGGFLLNPLDGNTYLAKMYQGWRGDWRFTLPYTAEPGDGAYLFLFYIFLGHLARLLNAPNLLLFHVARLLAAGLMVWALYRFFGVFLGTARNNGLVLAIVLLGTGLGWLAFPFGAVTSDLWVAETYPFLSAYANPHFPLGLALVLWLLVISYQASSRVGQNQLKTALLTALLSLTLGLVAPFGVVIVLVILAGCLGILVVERFWRYRTGTGKDVPQPEAPGWSAMPVAGLSRQVCWVALGGGPIIVYDLLVAKVDPVLAGWNAQNLTPSPPLWDLALSLSPLLVFAFLGVWAFRRFVPSSTGIFLVWAGLGLVLLYLPFGLQRRFMMGLYVPLVGLAALGLVWIQEKYSERASQRAGRWLLLLSLPTTLVVLLLAFYGIQAHDPVYYLTRGERQALNWIEENTPSRALILAGPDTGLYIPAYTGRRVIYGHPFETVNAQAEEAAVVGFFQDDGLSSPADFLEARHVDYLFYGPRERLLGDLPVIPTLQQVYSGEDVSIYQVIAE
jgi:hypothetical protein